MKLRATSATNAFGTTSFATKTKARKWLHDKSIDVNQKDGDLTWQDIEWIMREEDDETFLIRYNADSGYGEARYSIRVGNSITLAELFIMGDDELSCVDLYSTYVSLPTFIRGKVHSGSGSAEGIRRQNARLVTFDEKGTWGLPSRSGRSAQMFPQSMWQNRAR